MKLKNVFFAAIETQWSIAYRRKKKNEDILSDTKKMFFRLKNNFRYWCADPFVIEENGKTYIFFEAYDRFTNKGAIGYREINGNTAGKIKIIINEPFHLSYPYVYHDSGSWYMIPESGMTNKIIRYKAKNFPDLWEKEKVLVDKTPAVDTTLFICARGEMKILTYIHDKSFPYGKLEFINLGVNENKKVQSIIDLDGTKRPAGKILEKESVFYRPSQLCTNFYGEAIIFNKIIKLSNDDYYEVNFKTIRAVDLKINTKMKILGIHTYNSSENFEVIDFQTKKINLVAFIFIIFYYIRGKISQSFSNLGIFLVIMSVFYPYLLFD